MRKEFKEIASFRKPNCSITSYIISVWFRVSPLGTLLGFIYFHLHKSKGVCSKHLKESTPTHNDMSSVPEVSRTWPRKNELLTLGPIHSELYCDAAVHFVTLTSMMSEFSIRFSAMGNPTGEVKDV